MTKSQKQFIEKVAEGAKAGYLAFGILPSVTIAQAILESNWGTRSIDNNIFGVKAGRNWTGKTKTVWTEEVVHGERIRVQATFRAYDSIEESIADHSKVLRLDRYANVRSAKDYTEACEEIYRAGYATDPHYPKKLKLIIEKYKLYEYDQRKEGEKMDPTKVCNDRNQLDADTQVALRLFLAKCKAKNLPVRVYETYRSQMRQDYLYEQGRSRPGQIVTEVRRSFHTKRRAFDIIHQTLGWKAPESFWRAIAEIGRSIGLNCGYDWKKFQDRPHFQLNIGSKVIEEDEYMIEKTKLNINGQLIEVDRVLIENRNFIKLADLEKAGFKVGYDAQTKTPSLETN